MKHIMTILRRDIWSLVVIPTGAIVAALFALVCGLVFVSQILDPNSIATMRPVFEIAAWLLLLLCPAITMRLVAEERRVGTWELLLASPASSFEIAKGKIVAALLFLFLILATTLPLVLVLELYANVDYGAVASGYLGLLLLGIAVISTGVVISALTNSQTVAYVVTAFLWLIVSLATKVLPAYVPTRFADYIFALDPDLRTGEFSIGLIDSANIVYFFSIGLMMGWISIVAIDRTRRQASSIWRLVVCGILLVVSIIAVNDVSMHESFRWRFDATGSRDYTLSEQTKRLLSDIDSQWKIVVLLDDTNSGRTVIRQVDEVLRRYQEGSQFVEVQRINPANPEALDQYDALLRDLIEIYKDELSSAKLAIQNGIESFRTLMTFAGTTSVWAESASTVSSTPQEEETLKTLASALGLLGNEGGLILDEVDKALRIDLGQPLPRISVARDILVAATGQWSQELAEVAWWLQHESRSSSIKATCSEESKSFEQIAITLAQVDDSLRRLGALGLGYLATQLAEGEGVIIMSPDRATMIPASLVFPKNIGGQNSIAVDQRFRGEQIISSAMRSLQSTVRPTVVFVHAEEESLLIRRSNNVDLWSARGLLETSRFQVKEWIPFDGPRPTMGNGPVVWVVIPSSNRAGLELSPRERSLLDSVRGLLAGDESVMLNIQPSLLPRYGQIDPWADLANSIGLTVDSGKVLVQQVAIGPNQVEVQRAQMITELHSAHLISRAVNGMQIYLPLPMVVHGGDMLIGVQPSEDVWLEEQWERELSADAQKDTFSAVLPIAAAIEHHDGARAVVVGSGGWLYSWAADRAMSVGGNQIVMLNPGNSELLLACVEWLSGLDDWIAAGPIGQQTSRVSGLTKPMYFTWAAILILGVPSLLLCSAVFVYVRRST